MSSQMELEKFDFLRTLALEMGAVDAKIIPANKVVVEDRIVLKCKVGCSHYGKTLACPPYTPTPEEFRKIVGALLELLSIILLVKKIIQNFMQMERK